ncbi:MAG: formate dehydrogenase accessory sulfurtransferase FdhD [Chloroflexi bacterium]|nr:formate dehydrogenase accessory sulfurtransferase FdhD [Chloroflexota bacterium]
MEEGVEELAPGAKPGMACRQFSSGEWLTKPCAVPREIELAIYVNGRELVSTLCTPTNLTCLVLGFLHSEGLIRTVDEVASMRVCEEESVADVRLRGDYFPPSRRTLTSGCGGGTSFRRDAERVDSNLLVAPVDLLSRMRELHERAELFQCCGGVHASALSSARHLLIVAEDIGRHNTLDKIQGECLLTNTPTREAMLLTTGRVSSEMLYKAARMRTPVVVSRSAPTERAISLADGLGITLVGYARGTRLSVYSHEERVQGADLEARLVAEAA